MRQLFICLFLSRDNSLIYRVDLGLCYMHLMVFCLAFVENKRVLHVTCEQSINLQGRKK